MLRVLPAGGDERLAGAVVGKDLLGVFLGDRGKGDDVFLDHKLPHCSAIAVAIPGKVLARVLGSRSFRP